MSTPEQAPPAPAKPGPLPYKIVGNPIEANHFDQALGRIVTGYDVQVQWLSNGTVFTVFAPEGQSLKESVDEQARAKGAELDELQAHAG